MKSESKIDPEQLQRLIDNELSAVEIRELYSTARQHPSQWQTIACAFAEDQLFSREFETLAEPIDPKPVKPIVSKTEKASPNSMSLVNKLAIAASLTVAGLMGYMIGSDGPMPDESPRTNMIASNDSTSPSPVTSVDLQPEYRMELLTPDGEAVGGEVDLYRFDDLHRLVSDGNGDRKVTLNDILPPSGFSQEDRHRLNRSGYEINESTNFVSGRLQDGRQFVVPVRSIRFDQGH